MKVPFLDLHVTDAELSGALRRASERVIDSGWFIRSVEVEQFEREFADYCGTQHCVGVGNGLDALHLVLRAWGVGPGDEVIVPSNTYIATWLAVSYVGATIVPVEPNNETFNIDAAGVEAAITARTKAVIPVHLYGRLCPMDEIYAVAKKRDVKVLEDCAQSHGAERGGRRAGALSDAGAFSFYPGKNLGAMGDAGGVTTDDKKLADTVRSLGNYGSSIKYHHDTQGMNSRLDEIQAAFLRAKIAYLAPWNARRRAIAERYDRGLAGVDGLRLPAHDGAAHVWHLYVVRSSKRDALAKHLQESGVSTLIHYPIPPHQSHAYAEQRWPEFPLAEQHSQTVLSLPMGPHLDDAQVDHVIASIRTFFDSASQ